MIPVQQTTQSAFIHEGKSWDIFLPDGRTVTIRETNGDDDELLSTTTTATTNENIHKFLAAITKGANGELQRTPTEIASWRVNSKYYLLLKQRLLIHGEKFTFEYPCQNKECKTKDGQSRISKYDENLGVLDTDLSAGGDSKNPLAIFPYPGKDEKVIEFTLDSGRKFQFEAYTAEGEARLRNLREDELNRNTPLYIRNLKEFQDGNKWITLKHFKGISSNEMTKIRSKVLELDAQWTPLISFNCPFCGTPHTVNLFLIPAFLFPGE